MYKQFYQVDGFLPYNASSYVKRDADEKLFNYLLLIVLKLSS